MNSGSQAPGRLHARMSEPVLRLPVPLRDAAACVCGADELPGLRSRRASRLTAQTLAKLTGGVDLRQYRPDEELKLLAHKAIELGVADHLLAPRAPDETISALHGSRRAEHGLPRWSRPRIRGFTCRPGPGCFTPSEPGSTISRFRGPRSRVTSTACSAARSSIVLAARCSGERDQLTVDYRALLATDEQRAVFDEGLDLARVVAPHLQDHNFYIEHRHHTIFWNKMRQSSPTASSSLDCSTSRRTSSTSTGGRSARSCSTPPTAGRRPAPAWAGVGDRWSVGEER